MIWQLHVMNVVDGPLCVFMIFEMDEANTTTSVGARVNEDFNFSDPSLTHEKLRNIILRVF